MARKNRKENPLPNESASRNQAPSASSEDVLLANSFPLWKGLVFMFLMPIVSSAIQLQLDPSHGSLPAAEYQNLLDALPFAIFVPVVLLRNYRPELLQYITLQCSILVKLIPVIITSLPVIQLYLVPTARQLGPAGSALFIKAVTLLPLQVLITFVTSLSFRRWLSPSFTFVAGLLTAMTTSYVAKSIWQIYYADILQLHWVLSRPYLVLVIASITMPLVPSRLLLLAALPFMHTLLLSPHSTLSIPTSRLNSLLESHSYSLLHREEGLTGYLSVLENKKQGFRVMRCDHSFLGGNWIHGMGSWPGGDGFKGKIGRVAEPVYAVFTMLEAVRLVRTFPHKSDEQSQQEQANVPDSRAQALVIGLGIGTTPAALVAHGINTTVVEIDSGVYRLASKYFDLPKNHTSVIDDAIAFVEHRVDEQKNEKEVGSKHGASQHLGVYDYIIHDVFTGGAEPASLFTREFIQGLGDLLAPSGVIAINYASDLALPSTTLVLTTILSVFPRCRLFRDHPPEETTKVADTDFVNMVLFCRKIPGPFGFRKPIEMDFLETQSRRMSLLPNLEVDIGQFVPRAENGEFLIDHSKILSRNNIVELERWHNVGARRHWEVMRAVMPAQIWEMW